MTDNILFVKEVLAEMENHENKMGMLWVKDSEKEKFDITIANAYNFYVDFYNKDFTKISECTPLHLIDRLKALLNNIPFYQI